MILSAINEARAELKPAPFTVVTQADGRRYVEARDGTLSALPSESTDQLGKWAILDERAALLGDTDGDPSAVKDTSATTSSINYESPAVLRLMSAHPTLQPYFRMAKVGVPPENVVMRLRHDRAVAESVPEADVAQFFALVCNEGESTAEAMAAKATTGMEEAARAVGAALEGSHAARHGRCGDAHWAAPTLAVYHDAEARAGYNSKKGHEFLDAPDVLRAKVKVLAGLFRRAAKPVVYAGAGLSTASGIGDYATQTGQAGVLALSCSSGFNAVSPFCAKPNRGHLCLAAMARHGFVWRFVQQNHDGLPQKAGLPQHLVNEIHGSWFDPSNPVVAMSGALRTDLFEDLLTCEREADLVLAVGSSLCGMNADRLVSTCAHRHAQGTGISPSAATVAPSLGSVIVSLQQTVHDENCTLRIFALIDDVMAMLCEELGIEETMPGATPETSATVPVADEMPATRPISKDIKTCTTAAAGIMAPDLQATDGDELSWLWRVPYAALDGGRLPRLPKPLRGEVPDATMAAPLLSWDLRPGAELVVVRGAEAGAPATVLGRNKDGHWRVSVQRRFKRGPNTFTETRLLGAWWPAAAQRGEVAYIPLVPRCAYDAAAIAAGLGAAGPTAARTS